jgi:hypothetical protein
MANKADDEYAAFAAFRTTDGVPVPLSISTTAASIANLPKGRYTVILEGVSHVFLRTGGTATAPASGSFATGETIAVSQGWTYTHSATATLSAVTFSGSGVMILQPVPPPG